MKNPKQAFTTAEYALLMLIIMVALVSMAIYFKRAISGRMREVGDTFGHGRQYDPYTTNVRPGQRPR
jgi:Flp pilus assembly pilin Flp